MKAYAVTTREQEVYVFVFAENVNQAKLACLYELEEEYINLRAKRLQRLDHLYKGEADINWEDEEARTILVREYGFHCGEYGNWKKCKGCCAKRYCDRYFVLFGEE